MLENRKALLKLELEKQLNNLAKSYTKTKNTLDGLVTSTQAHKNASKDYLLLAKDTQKQIDKINAQDKITWQNKINLGELEDDLNTYRKLAIKENGKYLESEENLKKGNGGLEQSLVSLAQGVANGSINIEWLKNVNLDLYNDIISHTPAEESAYDKIKDRIAELGKQSGTSFDEMKASILDDINNTITDAKQKQELVNALNAVKKALDPTELKDWQKALQEALNVKNVSTDAAAVAEYTKNINTELAKSVDAAKTTGGDVAKVYSDYASKVNEAITSLIMSGQYVGSKPTIQSLKDFADGLQKISDSFGATGNTGATDEQIKKFKELGEEIKSLGNLSGDTFSSMKNYIIEEINNAGLLSDQVKELLQNLNDTKAATIDWGNYAEQAFEGALSSFSALGKAIATGDSVWSAFGAAALNAISSVLQGIGAELAIKAAEDYVMAASYASNPFTASLAPGAIASGVKATAASAAAYTAAGLVTGWASSVASMATGGIVEPSSGGSLVRVAENNNEEGIFNAGQSGKALIDSFTESMLKNMNNSGIGNQTTVS